MISPSDSFDRQRSLAIGERPPSYMKYQRERGIAGDLVAVLPTNATSSLYMNRFD